MASANRMTTPVAVDDEPRTLQDCIRFLETGEADGLFAPDLRSDFNFPYSRMQETSAEAVITLRTTEHPGPTTVHVERVDLTERGWLLQFEERWERGGESWYGRILLRADVEDGHIVAITVFDTGDWDEAKQREHAVVAAAGTHRRREPA